MQNYLILKYEDDYKLYIRWAKNYTGGTQTLNDVISTYNNIDEHGKIKTYQEVLASNYKNHLKTQTVPNTMKPY